LAAEDDLELEWFDDLVDMIGASLNFITVLLMAIYSQGLHDHLVVVISKHTGGKNTSHFRFG
jgi:hypothetical protein